MEMIRRLWKNRKRHKMNKRIKYSFSVPNTAYINWEEIDSEMALDDAHVFCVHTKLMGDDTVVAVSKDFLIKYSDVFINEGEDKPIRQLQLLGSSVNIVWGFDIKTIIKSYNFYDGRGCHDDVPFSYYKYMKILSDQVGDFKKEIEEIRAHHLPHSKVYVSSI